MVVAAAVHTTFTYVHSLYENSGAMLLVLLGLMASS